MSRRDSLLALLLCALSLAFAAPLFAQRDEGGIATAVGTSFTYQGELKQSGSPFSGTAEFHFRLYDALTAGSQVGLTLSFEGPNALTLANGRFTASLDFGASPFAGQARWLEIDVRTGLGPFTTLTPRQPLTAAPYALFALGSPPNATLALPYTGTVAANNAAAFSVTNTGSNQGGTGAVRALGTAYGVSANASTLTGIGAIGNNNVSGNYGWMGTQNYGVYGVHSATQNDGRLGDIGNGVWGIAVDPTSIGVRGTHLATGNYGLLGRSNFGVEGGNANGNYGQLGTATTGVYGETNVTNGTGVKGYTATSAAFAVYGYNSAVSGVARGVYGQTDSPDGYGVDGYAPTGYAVRGNGGVGGFFHGFGTGIVVENEASAFGIPARIDRKGGDGVVVQFLHNGGISGNISVAGNTSSYNAFTGSHFGWADAIIERGTLVCMTGVNRFSHDGEEGEVIYGITPSTSANDSKCMGTFLSLQEPNKPQSNDNPDLIMAVGNGDMWIAESSTGNIQPGDYLISSNVAGCAMKDDPQRFPIGYIVARAGEGVDWASVDSPSDGTPKRKEISVFFESFVRDSRGAELATIVEQQNQRIEALEAQVRSLQLVAERLARPRVEPPPSTLLGVVRRAISQASTTP